MIKHSWYLKDIGKKNKTGLKVFSTFSCGGGSTMGYKLAGAEVLGCLEIDEKMMEIYKANHNPKYSFKMAIQDFNKMTNEELPEELFDLDILDGSPPCSTFSMAGKREQKWGEENFFREGQEVQVLDDLFFHFIDTVDKLRPKVVIAENVKGLILGNAKGYVKEIFKGLQDIGYNVQLYLLNAAKMEVPQRRERTFFIARRKDLDLPRIDLNFNKKTISFLDATKDLNIEKRKPLRDNLVQYWRKLSPGEPIDKVHPKGHFFSHYKVNPTLPAKTIIANGPTHMHWDNPVYISDKELIRIQTFPEDFNFLGNNVQYVLGMSVPPYMIMNLVKEIYRQLFCNIPKKVY